MKKILLLLLFLAFSAATIAQTNDQYQSLFNKIDALINNYIEYSTLNTVDQPKVTDASVNRFIGLFTSDNAMVDYDMKKFNAEVTYHEVTCFTVKKYCEVLAEHNPMGLKSVKLIKADIDYKPLQSESKVRVLLEKKMIGTSTKDVPIESTNNTVMMTLVVSDNMSVVKIDSIIVVDPPILKRTGAETTDEELVPGQKPITPRIRSNVSRLYVAIDAKAGTLSQSVTALDFTQNYNSVITGNTVYSAPHFSSGSSFGFDAQLEYYFGKKANIGIGTGIAYFSQKGTMQMDNFHVEYQSVDAIQSDTFRQVIRSTPTQPISEQLTITNINIPILLKFKTQLNDKWGFAADAGVLFNLSITNSYTTNASFDYGAIYAFRNFTGSNNGDHISATAYYDNTPTPLPEDWVITSPQYSSGLLDTMASRRYNVGIGKTPTNKTGSVSYASGSIGFIIQPALTYKISKGFFLNLGVYYMSQTFSNTTNNKGYMITGDGKIGSYSSMLNSLSGISSSGFGINIGVKISII